MSAENWDYVYQPIEWLRPRQPRLAVRVAIVQDESNVLLVRSLKNGLWLLPGGMIDPGEITPFSSPIPALWPPLCREILEELLLDQQQKETLEQAGWYFQGDELYFRIWVEWRYHRKRAFDLITEAHLQNNSIFEAKPGSGVKEICWADIQNPIVRSGKLAPNTACALYGLNQIMFNGLPLWYGDASIQHNVLPHDR